MAAVVGIRTTDLAPSLYAGNGSGEAARARVLDLGAHCYFTVNGDGGKARVTIFAKGIARVAALGVDIWKAQG